MIGVPPMTRDSGTMKGARHIRGGRRRLCDVLYMAETSAMIWNPDMKATCERLRAKGEGQKVAIAAVTCRLIVHANTVLPDRRNWTERVPA